MEADAPEQAHRETGRRAAGRSPRRASTTWLIRLVAGGRCRRGGWRVDGAVVIAMRSHRPRLLDQPVFARCANTGRCGSRSSERASPGSARRTSCRARTTSSCSSATRAPAATRTRSSHDGPRARHRLPRPQRARTTRCSAGSSASSASRRSESEMSFSVSCGGCGLEYSGRRPFAQPRERARARASTRCSGRSAAGCAPPAARSTRPTTRLRRSATTSTSSGYSQRFRRHFLVPLTVGALVDGARARARVPRARTRSASSRTTGCSGFGRFRWRDGRPAAAATYVDAIARRASAAALHLGLGVRALRRDADGVELAHRRRRARARFDRVVVATHADQALALLADPSDDERRVLGALRVHRRTRPCCTPTRRFLPRARARARVVELPARRRRPADGHLLPEPPAAARRPRRDYCVTLNAATVARRSTCSRGFVYDHPLYTLDDARAPSASCRRSPGRGDTLLRRRAPRQRLPRGRARVRRARGRGARGAPGEVGALRRGR